MDATKIEKWVKDSREAQGFPRYVQDAKLYELLAEFLNAPPKVNPA